MLDACETMISPYFGITFLIFFVKIENAVYTSCQNFQMNISSWPIHYSKINARPAAQVLSSVNKVLLAYDQLEPRLQKQHAFVY